jgi:hypothetical protein
MHWSHGQLLQKNCRKQPPPVRHIPLPRQHVNMPSFWLPWFSPFGSFFLQLVSIGYRIVKKAQLSAVVTVAT